MSSDDPSRWGTLTGVDATILLVEPDPDTTAAEPWGQADLPDVNDQFLAPVS